MKMRHLLAATTALCLGFASMSSFAKGDEMPAQKAPVAQHQVVEQKKPAPEAVKTKPAPKKVASKFVTVKAGETLSMVAKKYHVSVGTLKKLNHLKGDKVHAGQRLRIS